MTTLAAYAPERNALPELKKVETEKGPHLVKYLGSYNENQFGKNTLNNTKFLSRLSPFLLLTLVLAVLIPYFYITGSGSIQNGWLLCSLFLFLSSNLLLADFAIWNYFEGRKKAAIWTIEIFFSFTIVYMLV